MIQTHDPMIIKINDHQIRTQRIRISQKQPINYENQSPIKK